jgi:hypothetical protein
MGPIQGIGEKIPGLEKHFIKMVNFKGGVQGGGMKKILMFLRSRVSEVQLGVCRRMFSPRERKRRFYI